MAGFGTFGVVELLEREGPLRVLAEARDLAARGDGCVVAVTGEPGIGKTALASHFASGLEGTVLWGLCDDLSIPRPFGPVRDLAASLAAPIVDALAGDAAPPIIHAQLIDAVRQLPTPTVLVLEDVHWADEATLDLLTVVGRRVRTLPALVVLTFRGRWSRAGALKRATPRRRSRRDCRRFPRPGFGDGRDGLARVGPAAEPGHRVADGTGCAYRLAAAVLITGPFPLAVPGGLVSRPSLGGD